MSTGFSSYSSSVKLTGMLKLWGKSNLANNTFKRLLKSFLNLSPVLKIPSFSPSDSEDQGARGWQDAQIFGNKGKVVQAGHCALRFLLLCHQNRTSNIYLMVGIYLVIQLELLIQ